MVLVVALFALLSTSSAEHRSRCGSHSEIGTTLRETGDGVDGRYTLEWCSKLRDNATTWNLKLNYIDFHNSSKECPQDNSVISSMQLNRFLKIHSVVTEELEKPFNCVVTCLSKPLDLIFSGCYLARSQLSGARMRTWMPDSATLQVRNRFGGQQAFNDLRPFYLIEKDGDTLTVRWDLHYIPVSDYTMEITEYQNSSDVISQKGVWVPIGDNCTHETYSVTCRLPAPAPRRCVAAALQHAAPWRAGQLFRDSNRMVYCAPARSSVVVPVGAARAPLWGAAGALLLALAVLAALWAAHSRLLAGLRKRTLRDWTHRYSEYAAPRAPKAPAPAPYILLLYARDCAPAMRCVDALRDMLEAAAPGRVVDLFAASSVRQYAPAPGAWLRAALCRPDLRLVLLHTPAAAALYAAQDQPALLHSPLLGSKVQYRSPHYGDALLQLALRLVRDAAHAQPEYTKYYVATIAEVPGDVVPAVASYRRYELPTHAAALLRDLRLRAEPGPGPGPGPDPGPEPEHLRRLDESVASLLHYIRDNENYLKDELMFLDHLEQ